MATDDSKRMNDATKSADKAEFEDLSAKSLDDSASKQVKGGKAPTQDIHVTKPMDKNGS